MFRAEQRVNEPAPAAGAFRGFDFHRSKRGNLVFLRRAPPASRAADAQLEPLGDARLRLSRSIRSSSAQLAEALRDGIRVW